MKDRLVIEFGKPGDDATHAHSLEGTSVIMKELHQDTGIEVGDRIPLEEIDSSDFTGREVELEFKSSESLAIFMKGLLAIHHRLRRQEWIEENRSVTIMIYNSIN